ncbi:hypothetical protein J437_LFUL009357 [Ladona fulva]|uniref:Transcription factor Adf-1 n=1 Tax=Ladona fulva TaxID=123851 RepID=A0A8K0K690_LADFU|nr:hypothetical protein J437_LFUL009357 [Ladona fulva]
MALPKENLISEVHSRPVLWYEDHPHYRRKNLRDKLWLEVADICGYASGIEAKTKWKSLKDQFRREMQKMPKYKPGSDTHTSKWQYFDLMRFIKDFDDPEKVQRNLRGKRDVEESNLEEDACDEEAENEEISNMDKPIEMSHSPEASLSSIQCGRKSRKIDTENETSSFGMEKQKIVQKYHGEEEENADLFFFKSLLPYMQEFSPLEKLHVRNDIQNVILNHYSRKNGEYDETV